MIVPCINNCDYGYLIQLVNNIINWMVVISVPVSAGVFAWAGILYMTSAGSSKKEDAKKMLTKVFWGFVFILSAWIIVTTITKALLSNGSNNGGTDYINSVPVQGVSK